MLKQRAEKTLSQRKFDLSRARGLRRVHSTDKERSYHTDYCTFPVVLDIMNTTCESASSLAEGFGSKVSLK